MSKRNQQICDNTNYEEGALQQEYRSNIQAKLKSVSKRYQKPALDSSAKALWEQIGEDLNNPSESRSRMAAATGSHMLAESGANLMDMVLARETHHEGWLQENGEDSHFASEGLNYASQVYTALANNSQMRKGVDLASLHSLDLPERYYTAARAYGFTKPWYDLLDKDFCNPSLEVRKIAWVAFDYSYIKEKGFEEEMDKEGIQEVYIRCYEKLVKEGVFTRPRKHNIARVYFNFALDNAQKNKHSRHPDPHILSDLSDEEQEAALNNLLTKSAEDEALHTMSEGILHGELVKPGFLTEKEYRLYRAIYVEYWTIEELAKQYGVKPGAIRQSLSEVHNNMILRRDTCIAETLNIWAFHNTIASQPEHPSPYRCRINFSGGHSTFFVQHIEEAMKPARRAAAFLGNSQPIFLPLTSGIAKRPGRLYLYTTGAEDDLLNRVVNYLIAHGIRRGAIQLKEIFLNNALDYLSGFPILDEIVNQLPWKELRLCGLNFLNNRDIQAWNERPSINVKDAQTGEMKSLLLCDEDIPIGDFNPARTLRHGYAHIPDDFSRITESVEFHKIS